MIKRSELELCEQEVADDFRGMVAAYIAGERRRIMNHLPDLLTTYRNEYMTSERLISAAEFKPFTEEMFELALDGE